MSPSISRRKFLKLLAIGAGSLLVGGVGYQAATGKRKIPGRLLGPSSALGHALRDGQKFPEPSSEEHVDILIVGGGMAGLSAGWWLQKHGLESFKLLEMETAIGGNSTSGRNGISAYPWAAHYVPIPGEDSKLVRTLFEELNVITGYKNGKPIYDPLYLCHDPDERLYKDGMWQDGLVPTRGATANDKRQIERFLATMDRFRKQRGSDGKRAFTIPVDHSSADESFRKFDRITMQEWLKQEKFTSRLITWYANYCCRDDYGATIDNVSAWAGIHYFAARHAEAANAEPDAVVTWPEGNGWLVNRLRQKFPEKIQSGKMAYKIEQKIGKVIVDVVDTRTHQTTRYIANDIVFAGPRFVAARVIPALKRAVVHTGKPVDLNQPPPASSPENAMQYAPWMVANVSVKHAPQGEGVALAWDNVSYHNDSLGYVVATHQDISVFAGRSVLTYYRPLSHLPPKQAREEAYPKKHADWTHQIVKDLESMHPGIEREIESIDVWVWGHGMITPTPGFIWSDARKHLATPLGKIRFAHSDMSGISIFEEAQYRGVEAARDILHARGMAS